MSVYCLDSNVFIRLVTHYPASIFGSLWQNLDALAQNGRLLVPRMVLEEVDSDQRAADWIKTRQNIILRDMDEDVNDCLLEVMATLPGFVDASKSNPWEADQFLVALALSENRKLAAAEFGKVCVASLEAYKKPASTRLRIPDACDHFKIPCIDLFGMIQKEGWQF